MVFLLGFAGIPVGSPDQVANGETPFRANDQCGFCALVVDSFPGKDWDMICDEYENNHGGFKRNFEKCRESAKRGVGAWLPKPVCNKVDLIMSFSQVFYFLSTSLFNVFWPEAICKELPKVQFLIVFDCENKERTGILVRPSQKARSMNLPKIKLSRTSFVFAQEDLCPANQIREGQSKEIWKYQVDKRVKSRNAQLKDNGCRKAFSIEKLEKLVNIQARELKRKRLRGDEGVIDVENGEDGTANRALVEADIDGEAPSRKKPISAKMKAKAKARKTAMSSFRGSVNRDRTTDGVRTQTKKEGRESTVLDVAGIDGEDEVDSAAGTSGEELSGSEGEIQKRVAVPVDEIFRGVTNMGNRLQGATTLATTPDLTPRISGPRTNHECAQLDPLGKREGR